VTNHLTAVVNSEDSSTKFVIGSCVNSGLITPNASVTSTINGTKPLYTNPRVSISEDSISGSEFSVIADYTREGKASKDVVDRILTTAAPYLDIEVLEQVLRSGTLCTFGIGEFSHKFHFRDVYGPKLDREGGNEGVATTRQNGRVCVEYIFYRYILIDILMT
jgi:hypothetical protein